MKKTIITGLLIFVFIIGITIAIGFSKEKESKDKAVKHEELVALGDSLTHGVGDAGAGYAGNLQKALTENQHNTVTVHNFGIPGQQSDGLLDQLKGEDIRERINKADYIILFIGTNDLVKTNGGDLSRIYEDRIEVGKEDYTRNLKDILAIIRKENDDAPVLLLGLFNPYPSSEEIEEVVNDWNSTSKEIVSHDKRVKYIPTNGLFKEKSKTYFSDALHPNSEGYELITKKIIEEYDF
ncbi:hypothetical protein E2R51_03680 [Jeotgalibacillus sp. S-D1]|uniref:DUF459 domain-containing protein n=1 Tax=Jeotgalibacillus sp. S-D1 TaxID=2552189 RepID=UPI001059B5D9|nr:GDSL-type esterase/lipase family protein [Jeotgalibacillus sp. S-D1]TDL34833.1 hypothetical protein E2R51_03680 [Jeotgalibacillus sp. S-D1]